jgi:Transposase DDE domain
VLTDANGIPLVVQTGPANQRDDHRLLPLLVDFPVLPCPSAGRPRTKPVSVQGDAGYGFPTLIGLVRWLGITPLLKPRGTDDSGSGLGKTRYVVERTLSWFNNFRRLRLCYEKTPEHFQAFHELAAALICAKRLLC